MNEEKPKQPAADFYPRGYKTDSRPQRGWWAPGHYLNRCVKCGDGFIGDKRAGWCADCAYKWEAADDSAKAMRSGPINTKRSDEYAMNPEPTNNDSHEAARPPQGGVDQQRRSSSLHRMVMSRSHNLPHAPNRDFLRGGRSSNPKAESQTL